MSLRFRSQLQIDNLPDPQTNDKWEVILPSINLDTTLGGIPYTPIVEEIVFRGANFENEEIRVGTKFYNLPKDRASFGTCTMTLYCEQGMLPVYYLQEWRYLMFNPEHQFYYVNKKNSAMDFLKSSISNLSVSGNRVNATSNWKKDINVFFYGLGSATPIAQATLYNAYPISQDDYRLEYTMDPKRVRINATFAYDNVIWSSSYKEAAILSSLLAGNPIGTVADQLAATATKAISSWSTGEEAQAL